MQTRKDVGCPLYTLTCDAWTVVYDVFGMFSECELFILQKLNEE